MKKILITIVLCLAFINVKAQNSAEVVDLFFDALNSKDIALLESLCIEDLRIHSLNLKKDSVLTSQSISEFSESIQSIPDDKTILEEIRSKQSIESDHIALYSLKYSFYVNNDLSHSGTNVMTLIKTDKGWKISYIADTRE